MPIYTSVDALDFALTEVPTLPYFDQVEMADPEHFDVQYAINPHMLDKHGELQKVNRQEARKQWKILKQTIEQCGVEVHVAPPMEGHPDFVFCANPWLPIPAEVTGEEAHCVPSRMASNERAREVEHWSASLQARGWTIAPLTGSSKRLEGTGDGLWHPGRQVLWGGVGSRTDHAAWEELSERYELRVMLLELQDPALYHLDTALAPLDEQTCLWSPSAFNDQGADLIQRLFKDPIAVTEEEAHQHFVCNAFAPSTAQGGREVLMQPGATRIVSELNHRGFRCIEVDTGEFLKAGGSVFCMKMAHPGG
jgi:N-dimethylarginine dimethylaminohydrolase